jgi:oxygen-independent coproporphyrinogen-3 oxidase
MSLIFDLEELKGLFPRYAIAGPRYTSYPTVPAWTKEFGPSEHVEELRALPHDRPVSVYAHVPFCKSLCHFCACNRVITKDAELVERYLRAIEREIETTHTVIGLNLPCRQLHWGGGTPTHLSPDQIERLFRVITKRFDLLPDAEISIEVDPRVTTAPQIEMLASCGFNRISLGVQDTNRKTQEAIHRIQSFEQTLWLTEVARKAGIERVNYDLIYGLPHQTVATFAETLDAVLTARPDRIALYGYAHVTWVAKQQRGFERGDLPDTARRLEIFLSAIQRLADAGYRAIGMDHFALPEDELSRALDEGTLRRNFMGYTTHEGVDLLGFGPSAISEFSNCYSQVEKSLDAWFAKIEADQFATAKGHRLSEDDLARRWIIGRIMCETGVSAAEVESRFGGNYMTDYKAAIARLQPLHDDGLINVSETGDVSARPLGTLFLRHAAMAFDAYLDPVIGRPEKAFSQTL